MATSVGSIFVDFIARTVGLDTGVQNAAATVRSFSGQIGPMNNALNAVGQQATASFTKVGMGLSVVRMAARMFVSELEHVSENIDRIPGIPADVVESVKSFTASMQQERMYLDQASANFMANLDTISSNIAYEWLKITEGTEEADEEFGKALEDQQNYWTKTIEYQKEVEAEEKKLQALLKEHANIQANPTKGAQADAAREAAAALQRNAKAGALDELSALKEQVEAEQDLNGAMRTHASLAQELAKAQDKLNQATMAEDKNRDPVQYMKDLEDQKQAIYKGLAQAMFGQDAGTDAAIEKQITLTETLTTVTDKLTQMQAKAREGVDQMRNTFVSGFQGLSGVLTDWMTGSKANFRQWAADTVKSILNEFIKLDMINPLLNSIFSGAQGYNKQPTLGGGLTSGIGALVSGFLAGGGPASQGQAYIVGEQGPEVFVPGSSGTVMPNSSLQAVSSDTGSKGGQTFNQTFNVQSGVSHAEFAAAMPRVIKAAQAAMVDAVRRGGPYAAAFGQ